jgi:hypothetical protein
MSRKPKPKPNRLVLGKGCKAQCQRCQRLAPATNIKALIEATRRHREKYHKGEKGPIKFSAPKKRK